MESREEELGEMVVGMLCQCRICHEEEDERSTAMESPCACSGSLKFAHRSCIQRWCEEKGSTLCEICLQNFEPNYTIPPKMALLDVPVTIRSSLEVPRQSFEHDSDDDDGEGGDDDERAEAEEDFPGCSAGAAEKSFSYCRSAAVMLTVFLFARHLLAILSVGADEYAFTLVTVFALRASGILLPFYLLMRLITAIQHAQWRQYHRQHLQLRDDSVADERGGDEHLHQHVIEISE